MIESEVREGLITKAWHHDLSDDSDTITVFQMEDVPGAFHGPADWLPLLEEAISIKTRVRVMASIPAPEPCGDPLCGDGCCEDPDCTNVPLEERQRPFVVRADTIEWLDSEAAMTG
jgi:hypothetical protein